jgi:hypothetical protein
VLLSENATANEPKPEDSEEGYADYRLEKREGNKDSTTTTTKPTG